MSRDDQKVAIVTGGSRGIGAAICARLASDGFAVVVNYSGDDAAADAIVQSITSAGGTAVAVKADVSNPADVAELFDKTEAALGVPSVVVNSAGIMKLSPIAQCDDATFDQIIAVNLKGTFNILRECAKRLGDGSRVINLSSSVVGLNMPTYGVYAATKAAVETLTAILSKEMRGRSITVNAIAPGPTATDLFLNGKTEEQIAGLAKMNPLERLGQPEDIANAISFLAGPDGTWINGQTIRANGGMI